MNKYLCFIVLLFCVNNIGFSQSEFIVQNKKQSDKVNFKLLNNLIVIPVEINGVILSFILDTGVSKPIIFNFLNVSDTLKIKNTETIYLRGLGEGESVKALKSTSNIFKVGDAIKLNQELYAVYDFNLNFAPRLGTPVHGIIGYDLFKDLIVEINYSNSYLKLTNPNKYRYKNCRKCEVINLEFYNNKPYIDAEVKIHNKKIPIKLLIDSGGSDSLWLFEDDSLGIISENKSFDDFLGHGLSGSVFGKRSRIDAFYLKSFELINANVAYPDSSSISVARNFKDRNGSLAGNILKRFNMIFDYQKAIVTLKKNEHFKEKFSYNRSGIELAHEGVRLVKEIDNAILLGKDEGPQNSQTTNSSRIVIDTQYKLSLKPAYAIVELREGSPAERAGLRIHDIILSINNKPSYNFTLQQLTQKFYGDVGTRIKLKVERNGHVVTFSFDLEKPF
ncbi:Aspartyl protease [Flaviramulus basaltis]|uniref:Aspartyl protease n=1 Tax=Flaviramulus basaltis TaxID=369401 RepID=A0A1K2INQ5_9FLAO|nr:aspartyl protease family protein [Flaviramulus basaltis]SFZ93840.1 Aspartyl protease [Flaviramulus basaltis]